MLGPGIKPMAGSVPRRGGRISRRAGRRDAGPVGCGAARPPGPGRTPPGRPAKPGLPSTPRRQRSRATPQRCAAARAVREFAGRDGTPHRRIGGSP